MKKAVSVLLVAVVFGLALAAHAYAMGSMHKKDLMANYDVNHLIGSQVTNPAGETLGAIHDFVIDQEGRVVFAVLDHEGKFVAIPFTALTISGTKPEEMRVLLNTDMRKLDGAPEYDMAKAMTDRKWAGEVYRYFGQQPYWTEPEAQPMPESGGVGY
jgi:hypothetical protein